MEAVLRMVGIVQTLVVYKSARAGEQWVIIDGHMRAEDFPVFAVGFVASFVAAMWAVKGFIRFISNHTFVVFAWYRIVFGLIVLGTAYSGVVSWSAA